MGFVRQSKDLKQSVKAAPEMLAQARALGVQGQGLAAAQQAAAAQLNAQGAAPHRSPGSAPSAAELEPIAGVSLALYADISKGLAEYGYDPSKIGLDAAMTGAADFRGSASIWLDLTGTR